MLKTRIITLMLLILSVSIATQAQSRRKKTVVDEAELARIAEQERVEELYESMLSSTAQLLVVDSVVTDSANFLEKIPLSKVSGRVMTYDQFQNTKGETSAYAFINEFGNKAFFSKNDGFGRLKLYTADKLDGKWANIRLIDDFGDEFEDMSYPFLMADGTTLYFAARNKEGLGGYDIYVTRYDISSEKFFTPENVGLPYNSTGNDYFCIIDDFNQIGWLVTDRRQPAGKVCVYTFVPTQSRDVYDEESFDEEKMRSLGDLASIQDTWMNHAELQAARARLEKMKTTRVENNDNQITFVVNDQTVYTSTNDFKSATNKKRFKELCNMKAQAESMGKELDNMRRNYSEGTSATKRKLSTSIMETEQRIEELETNIKTLEKDIRNTENMSNR